MTGNPLGHLVVLVGPAGAGKSTWATHQATTPTEVVSLDGLRGWVADDPAVQTATVEAVTLARVLILARLRRGLRVILDSTATEASHRRQWAQLARRTDATTTLVVFTTPLPVCLDRNQQRPEAGPGRVWGPRVPEAVVRAQHAATTRLVEHLQRGGRVPGYHHTHLINPDSAADVDDLVDGVRAPDPGGTGTTVVTGRWCRQCQGSGKQYYLARDGEYVLAACPVCGDGKVNHIGTGHEPPPVDPEPTRAGYGDRGCGRV